TRLLHRDSEDNRILKIIVYLNDVDARGGPFEFIPRPLSPPPWRIPHHGSRIADDAMAGVVPPPMWSCCTGERGTAIFADTCRVYHRGRIAEREDRLTLFFCYNSANPLSPQWCRPLFDRDRFLAATPNLSAVQRAAITPPYLQECR
ncbi:MAG: 2OG-Fe(II) oxygenase, partial [Alphaproteobacteria bacterium]|nr:2OG-Fe(II) oxygenase [Alphaproteobacteria bacterium]